MFMKPFDLTEYVDLASERLGGIVLFANDEFFAPKENLLKASNPIFIEDKYTEFGKWMDGWETRRRRDPGNDWCVIKLGVPGVIRGFVVDTSYFRGNYPEHCSIEACTSHDGATIEDLMSDTERWIEILPKSRLKGDTHNQFVIKNEQRFTHLRFNIFPDGGVARLKVYGEVVPDIATMARANHNIDLAAIVNGGRVIQSSDMFFGHRHNLIMPGPGLNMGDGWETKRRRGPGHDWCIIKLCAAGSIKKIEVDTSHFKGNYPESCKIEACDAREMNEKQLLSERTEWFEIIPRTKLKPDTRHYFSDEIKPHGTVTHVRLSIYPDGGISRLRLFGRVSGEEEKTETIIETVSKKSKKGVVGKKAERNIKGVPSHDEERFAKGIEHINSMSLDEAEDVFFSCCGSTNWSQKLAERRPFADIRELKLMAYYIWWALDEEDWLEAFSQHPRIGEKKAPKNAGVTSAKWSSEEQKEAQQGSTETLRVLADANRVYEQKFGFVFLICATGKRAGEIVTALYKRLSNDKKTEIHIAAEEQLKITQLRLQKLLEA
jgi:allantoicase